MTTPADIVNRAIQLTGGFNNLGAVTGSPPTFDSTPYGQAAGILYTSVVQTVGRQFGWDFSRNVAALTLTGEAAPLGYAFEYLYPTNGIQVRQLVPEDFDDPNDPLPILWTVGNATGNSTAASGYISFSANPSNGDTITLNGAVFTFVTSGATPTNFQSNIGGNVAATLALLVAMLPPNGYTGIAALTVADYARATPRLTITYGELGVVGNTYTLAASVGTVSGATLTGGAVASQKVIWTDLEDAIAVFSNQPPVDTWDPLFTEAVVRLLASELAMAVSSKPDSAKMALEQSVGFESAGETRTDT